MHATSERMPNWMQAPCCGEVWHEACLTRYASQSDTNEFKCPQCKTNHDARNIDEWDASEVVDRLFPEDEFSPEDETSSSSYESDADDTDANKCTRRTRSQGAPEKLERRTRSSGRYM
jgi:hypothetical protein